MNDKLWQNVLQNSRRILGVGDWDSYLSESWCSYTTFSSFRNRSQYWSVGFPQENECLEHEVMDGGLWRQKIVYADLAHLIIPAEFSWDRHVDGIFKIGQKIQNLDALSACYSELGVKFQRTDFLIEIKLF